ncbi:protein HEG-like [Ptychodera flava]|uniref:protein HEG-like n=1 Tax=Ptychodera flava TaxID=63121 RepID=UPI00396A036D
MARRCNCRRDIFFACYITVVLTVSTVCANTGSTAAIEETLSDEEDGDSVTREIEYISTVASTVDITADQGATASPAVIVTTLLVCDLVCSNGECVIVNGQPTCLCYQGYQLAENDNTLCEDIDECLDNPCTDVNERCINTDGNYTCECTPGTTLDENGICQESRKFVGEIRVTELDDEVAVFNDSLNDPSSAYFKSLAASIEAFVRAILDTDSRTSGDYFNARVVAFREGSIIAEFSTEVRYESDVTSETVVEVFQNPSVENITVEVTYDKNDVVVQDFNYCESSDTNDCSPYAECFLVDGGAFNCSCDAGYDDLSPLSSRPGRTCQEICPSDYCLNGGTCLGNSVEDQVCRCPSGYTGDRCELFTGQFDTEFSTFEVVAIIIGVIAGVLLVPAVVMTVCWFRITRRRKPSSRQRRGYFARNILAREHQRAAAMAGSASLEYPAESLWESASVDSSSDSLELGASHGGVKTDDEGRMKVLANVMRHSSLMNERLRARLREYDTDDPQPGVADLPTSGFIVPYIATGEEAALYDRRQRASEAIWKRESKRGRRGREQSGAARYMAGPSGNWDGVSPRSSQPPAFFY